MRSGIRLRGSNYFNTGRANGLNFYESATIIAFGSATCEYFGETSSPSLNDFINTTLGGIALGEMFHRAAWLVRNTRATGRARLWSEIGAMAIDHEHPEGEGPGQGVSEGPRFCDYGPGTNFGAFAFLNRQLYASCTS